MITIHELLYLDDDIKDRMDEIEEAVRENRILPDIYYVALSSNQNEQLDIFSGFMFYMERKHREDLVIVGLAQGKDAAYELVQQMAADTYAQTGSCNLRAIFD